MSQDAVPVYPTTTTSARPSTNGLAITGMVLGIVGVIPLFAMFVVPSLLGVIFSTIAWTQIGKNPTQPGKGFAITGVVTGFIGLAFWPGMILLAVIGSAGAS